MKRKSQRTSKKMMIIFPLFIVVCIIINRFYNSNIISKMKDEMKETVQITFETDSLAMDINVNADVTYQDNYEEYDLEVKEDYKLKQNISKSITSISMKSEIVSSKKRSINQEKEKNMYMVLYDNCPYQYNYESDLSGNSWDLKEELIAYPYVNVTYIIHQLLENDITYEGTKTIANRETKVVKGKATVRSIIQDLDILFNHNDNQLILLLEQMKLNAKADVTAYFYTDTKQLASFEIDLSEACENSLKNSSELNNYKFHSFTIQIIYTDYNKVDTIHLPKSIPFTSGEYITKILY
ncbi:MULTISPECIES: hypothetical protein [unclassified Breznakia]|uniref:hypothetical protein n=1 Tax=unclassified Breznakia TaxID=2623764 RepID=UPI002404F137|nr:MULTISPECIES: hypothetical protein [unclassified Breznakia]MDF9837047.1 hypothetical protein [Breznakia sp. PFB2-8]MDF9858972.1 hypothetical protein [Breznakia sp. PH5-24]